MFGENITMSQAVIVCAFSLAVVFLVLLTISYIIDLTAWILKKTSRKKEVPETAVADVPAAPEKKDDTAEVALIAAAVAAYLGKSSDQFVVRSIRRITSEETSWSQISRTGSAQ